jgi:chorismate mutase/prephenate dehydratase
MANDGAPEFDEHLLDELRAKIDAVDHQLIELINERAKQVVEVGKIKRQYGLPIYTPHREAAVLKKVTGLNKGPLKDSTFEAVYRELMSGSFYLEQPLRIGFLGPVGSYCHMAAVRHFGSSVKFEDLHAVEGVFTEVMRTHVDYGLVPIENSSDGGSSETLDAFRQYHEEINIYAEVQLEKNRCLLANCQPSEVKKIYGSRNALIDCRKWLATQYPAVQTITMNTSSSATQAAFNEFEADPQSGAAAIGSFLAGEIYKLRVLFEKIEDEPNNITRFLILSKQETNPSGDDKTSIMFTTSDRPGALVDVLSVFKNAKVNLTHIDKRPSGRVNWDYTFFIDAAGHRKDPKFAEVVGEARAHCKELAVLGSYPRSQRVL